IRSLDVLDVAGRLTSAGKYAYAGLCAVSLHQLFNFEWDEQFRGAALKRILQHLQLPEQVEPVMALLLNGEMVNSPDSLIGMLREEEAFGGNLTFILQDLIAIAVQEGEYDARWRVLIRHFAKLVGFKLEDMELYEINVVHCLTREQRRLSEEEKKAMKSRETLVKVKRYALIGLASIGGGALIGVTGGLAAPLIGMGLGTVVGGSAILGTLGTGAGIAVCATLFGAAGAGLAGYKMNKRVGEIEEFAFGVLVPLMETENESQIAMVTTPQLDITIAISGWIKDESEGNFTEPWESLRSSREQYYLRYESSYLLELGRALDYVVGFAVSLATQEALKYTILSGLMSAITWPAGLLGLASIIDNPWGVCCRRSAQVGKHLAEVLLAREHGRRPVILIGYSLGARVIFYCLREMAEREKCEGIVQDVYLMGAPCSGNPKRWEKMTKVVAGQIVNAYCRSDWLLRFLYRTLSMPRGGVAGLQPIQLDHQRLRNVDISHIISGMINLLCLSQKGGKLHLPFSVVSCVLFFWNMFRRLDAIFRLSDCGLSVL
ncbi:hypothetical protein AAG570_005117, partial [Ranatra chinensis]